MFIDKLFKDSIVESSDHSYENNLLIMKIGFYVKHTVMSTSI